MFAKRTKIVAPVFWHKDLAGDWQFDLTIRFGNSIWRFDLYARSIWQIHLPDRFAGFKFDLAIWQFN
jgi:hypothetical protein